MFKCEDFEENIVSKLKGVHGLLCTQYSDMLINDNDKQYEMRIIIDVVAEIVKDAQLENLKKIDI